MVCPFCDLERPASGYPADEGSPRVLILRDAYPVTPGHTLVIPRHHIPTYFEAPDDLKALLWAAVDHVKAELDEEFSPDGYNVGFNVGTAAGQTVDHLHIHVIPRHADDMPSPAGGVRGVIPSKQKYGRHLTPDTSALSVGGGREEDALLGFLLEAMAGAHQVDLALAFIFRRGLALLEGRLRAILEQPNALVRIITGRYQDVTEPEALRALLGLADEVDATEHSARLQVRAYTPGTSGVLSFHPKAWVIHRGEDIHAWVGSSNMSRTALVSGVEWNQKVTDPGQARGVVKAFEDLWSGPRVTPIDQDWIDEYIRTRAPRASGAPAVTPEVEDVPVEPVAPLPGPQSIALLKLQQTRMLGNEAGLVVLATGLGKTYLAAFDSVGFERVLFIAHREEILKQALATFRKVRLGDRMGLYYGKQKDDPNAQLLFASVDTLARDEHLHKFQPSDFDYIVVDEFHHAAAATYRKILQYFTPKFMLGLTATPDRTDGASLLSLCDGNEVYRADIPEGLQAGRLSPFHYYGIRDNTEYERIPWRLYANDSERLGELVSTVARARHAHDKLREYTQGKVKALGFCVNTVHAQFMADQFTALGVKCAALYSGSGLDREETLAKLAAGEHEIVFCVDMLSEGVDVPDIDTVFMLRPTQSSIVWLQQLGRGLRHVEGKVLTVLDYIGNHAAFLKRPQMLLEALSVELPGTHTPSWTHAMTCELPEGVAIEFDLEAQDVLETLRKESAKAQSKDLRWYREFYEAHDARPSALQANKAGYYKRLAKRAGGWFTFIGSEGHLSDAERAVLGAHPEFFADLGGLQGANGDEMLALQALIAHRDFPGEVDKADLASWISSRARRNSALMRGLSQGGAEPNVVLQWLTPGPLARICDLGGGNVLEIRPATFACPGLRSGDVDTLRAMIDELVEMHLAAYLEKENSSAIKLPPMQGDSGEEVDARLDVEEIDGHSCVVFHSRGGTRGSGSEHNTEYKRGLALLLRRMTDRELSIERIEVISQTVMKRGLSAEQRTAELAVHTYPLDMTTISDPQALAREIGGGVKKVGQADGAKGGNDTKKIRIVLTQSIPSGELWSWLQRGAQ